MPATDLKLLIVFITQSQVAVIVLIERTFIT